MFTQQLNQVIADSTKIAVEVRVVAVMLMDQYLLPEYIEKTVKTLDSLYDGDYYGSMGIAWALATAYAKFRGETMALLKGGLQA